MLLSELYMQDKDSLLKDLQNAPTPQGAIHVIHAYLAKLTDLEGSYVSGLTRPQARVALSILSIYQEHFRRLLDTFERLTKPISEQPALVYPRQRSSRPHGFPTNDTLAGIGAATLVAAFLTNPFLAIPLAAVAGLAAATLLPGNEASVPVSAGNGNTTTITQSPAPHFDYSVFLSNLEQLFKTVDDVIGEFNRLEKAARPQPVVPKLEDHPRFLEFIQDLLGWYQRKKSELPDAAAQALESRLEEQLPDLFSEYNIQVRYYTPESSERDLNLFDFEDEVGEHRLNIPLMVRPALSKEGEVLLRGRVIEPRPPTSSVTKDDHLK